MRTIGLFSLLIVAGCGPTAEETAPPPPPLVTVSKPVRKDVVTYIDTTGRTQAVAVVEVRARVEGILEEMEFEVGSEVEQGDVLFVIQKADYEAQRNQAEADLKAAEAAAEKARSDLERLEEAYRTNAVSGTSVTEARALKLGADAAVLSAQAALQRAELSLSYCDVLAPITGKVGRNLVDVGNLVGSSDRSVLTTVVQRQPIYVYFEIPEKYVNEALRMRAARLERGEEPDREVLIALPDEEDFRHSGLVDWVDNQVDRSTGTLRARARFDNESDLLYSGVFVRVRVVGDPEENAILVEEAALSIDLGGKYLLLVNEDSVVERRYVTPGQLEGTMRVIDDGLEGDERYISNGLIRARPGLPVRIQVAGAEPPSAAE